MWLLINDGKRYGTNVENLPDKYPLFDIGVDTLVRYIQIIENAGTVIANGPMGVFEDSNLLQEQMKSLVQFLKAKE